MIFDNIRVLLPLLLTVFALYSAEPYILKEAPSIPSNLPLSRKEFLIKVLSKDRKV
jgi:hypothetical protein